MTTGRGHRSAAVTVIAATVACATNLLVSAGCERSPTGPSPANPERLTVTLSESGVSPATVKVPMCTYSSGLSAAIAPCHFVVEFVNRDSEPHDVRSDPHPNHTACPDLNIEGIAPGQSKTTADLFGCFAGFAWRTYHDETRPDDSRFQGRLER